MEIPSDVEMEDAQNAVALAAADSEAGDSDGGRQYVKLTAADVRQIKQLVENGSGKPRHVLNQIRNTIPISYSHTRRIIARINKGESPEAIAAVKTGRGEKLPEGQTESTLLETAREKFDMDNAECSQRVVAKQLNIFTGAVNKLVRKCGLEPLKKIRCQKTNKTVAGKRMLQRKELPKWLDRHPGAEERIFFSDESIFYPRAAVGGAQNQRVYADAGCKKKDVPDEKILQPRPGREKGVMVSVCLSTLGGGVSATPHFTPGDQAADSAYYRNNIVGNDLWIQMQEFAAASPVPAGSPLCSIYFQEDGASARAALDMRRHFLALGIPLLDNEPKAAAGLKNAPKRSAEKSGSQPGSKVAMKATGENASAEKEEKRSAHGGKIVANGEEQWRRQSGEVCWPANSPDFPPLDFFFWGEVEAELAKGQPKPKNAHELKPLLKSAIASIPAAQIRAACLSFRSRLEQCVANGGRPFEHKRPKKKTAAAPEEANEE